MRRPSHVPSPGPGPGPEPDPITTGDAGVPDPILAPLEFNGLVAGTELLLTSRTLEVRREQVADVGAVSGTGRVQVDAIDRVSVRIWPAGPATLQVRASSEILEIVLHDPAVAERARTAIEEVRERARAAGLDQASRRTV